MAKDDKAEDKRFTIPEGRLINQSLFIKDVYKNKEGKEGIPSYKAEVAIPEDLLDDLLDAIMPHVEAAIIDKWGEKALKDFVDDPFETQPRNGIFNPLKIGDDMAADREAEGKKGDAYKGMVVLRCDTQFNFNGDNAPGGVQVYGTDAELIQPANQAEIYNGCYGILALTCRAYDNNGKGIKFHLTAFQKTKDGERLKASADHSQLFAPVKGGGRSERSSRRSRR